MIMDPKDYGSKRSGLRKNSSRRFRIQKTTDSIVRIQRITGPCWSGLLSRRRLHSIRKGAIKDQSCGKPKIQVWFINDKKREDRERSKNIRN